MSYQKSNYITKNNYITSLKSIYEPKIQDLMNNINDTNKIINNLLLIDTIEFNKINDLIYKIKQYYEELNNTIKEYDDELQNANKMYSIIKINQKKLIINTIFGEIYEYKSLIELKQNLPNIPLVYTFLLNTQIITEDEIELLLDNNEILELSIVYTIYTLYYVLNKYLDDSINFNIFRNYIIDYLNNNKKFLYFISSNKFNELIINRKQTNIEFNKNKLEILYIGIIRNNDKEYIDYSINNSYDSKCITNKYLTINTNRTEYNIEIDEQNSPIIRYNFIKNKNQNLSKEDILYIFEILDEIKILHQI